MNRENSKSRENGRMTKEKLIFQSFVLFSLKPYDKVTFVDIEKATELSRGAILYHFDSKQAIFNAVVEFSMIGRASILDIPFEDGAPLKSFITNFLDRCKSSIKEMAKYGIKNMNLAHYNIESQALYYYDQFDKLSKQMRATEHKVWTNVIKKAQDANEIKRNFDPEMLATLFLNAYLGHAYSAAIDEKGCDTNLLYNELIYLYKLSI